MGYTTTVLGHITIVPELNAAELRQHPELQKVSDNDHPSHQECYIEVERHTTTTLEGETVKLSGPRILVTDPDSDFSRYGLDEQLKQIVSAYPSHRFTGYLELHGEDGGQTRLVVKDGAILEIEPVITWPEP